MITIRPDTEDWENGPDVSSFTRCACDQLTPEQLAREIHRLKFPKHSLCTPTSAEVHGAEITLDAIRRLRHEVPRESIVVTVRQGEDAS